MEGTDKASHRRRRKRKWKPVSLDSVDFFQGDMEGFVSLEVLEGDELENDVGGKVMKHDDGNLECMIAKSKPSKKKSKKKKKTKQAEIIEKREDVVNVETENLDEDIGVEVESEWTYLGTHIQIGKRLLDLGFQEPTMIQRKAIPPAIQSRMDIIGAAETGSGKTLAYGIPVLQRILEAKLRQKGSDIKENDQGVRALILAPTRELALQVHKNLQDVAKTLSIKVACIVGGMSEEKQQRVLRGTPEVVVGTPGRLWHLIEQGQQHLSNVSNLQSLVIDEADRMIQEGHYQELSFLMDKINISSEKMLSKLQKFVFSATLTYSSTSKKNNKDNFDTLLKKIGLREKSKVIDLTRKGLTVESLTEAKLMCSVQDKDVYLYYFLKKYPKRTLVFVNTIDTLRRLLSILNLLKLAPLALHAGIQQRQRLKNLDRFKSRADGLLLASDVAARGLDIKGVQHVIHYQIPKNAEVYVHRSGRTARIQNEGLSLLLIGPDDLRSYEKIWKGLKKDNEPPDFPVDIEYLNEIRKRVSLARTIDKEEHQFRKKKWSNDWFLNNAKEAELEIDEDLLEDLGDSREQRVMKERLSGKKAELNALLDIPLASSGFVGKYPTKEGKLQTAGMRYAQNLKENGEVVPGHKDVKKAAVKKRKNKR
ncbi:ATP-dependent RNA helicase DDX24-like [Dendronephthya gigantea]|uniref:ATP-dependent RNA helicase DDX24-like n=1 Tax=Dendronephthya gigantea TaxID=151771 RepID=UPI00106D9B5C|nr:ATP-dependent RNA helicase DDX24-like [Dendronephthya gigantea]